MIWNAPVELNVLIVNLIKITIYIFIFLFTISLIAIIDMLIYYIKNKSEPGIFIIKKYIKVLSIGIFLPSIFLLLFYKAHPVFPNNYIFNKITLEYVSTNDIEGERITITDEKALVEFRKIFEGYCCRRTLLSRNNTTNTYKIYCDFLVNNGDKSSPIHFIFTQDEIIRYIGANTNFFYIIKDDQFLLANRIIDYFNKYYKEGYES